MGLVEFYLFLDTYDKMCTVLGSEFYVLDPVNKIRYLPLLIPNIPLLQYSIIPVSRMVDCPCGVKPKPGLLGQDSLFFKNNSVIVNGTLDGAIGFQPLLRIRDVLCRRHRHIWKYRNQIFILY